MNAPVQFDDPTKLNWWRAALNGERRPITVDPMTGYYRARRKNKQTGEERLYAVAYWWYNGKCFCKVNGGETLQGNELQRMIEAWPHVSKEPIEHKVYQDVVAGKPWPDQHVPEKAASATSSQPLDTQAPPSGAEAAVPPAERTTEVDTSPQAVLARDIKDLSSGLSRYVKRDESNKPISLIDSDDMAGAAQSLRAQLLALANKAKKAREEANRPHNEAIRTNGKIWTPLEDEAKRFADMLRDGPLKAWEQFKRDQQEAAAKAAAAAERTAVAAGQTSAAPVEPKSNAPAPSAKIKGATGKAASVSLVKTAVIEDQDKVYQFFRENEQLKAILQGLSNGAVRAGIEVPGTKIKEEVNIK